MWVNNNGYKILVWTGGIWDEWWELKKIIVISIVSIGKCVTWIWNKKYFQRHLVSFIITVCVVKYTHNIHTTLTQIRCCLVSGLNFIGQSNVMCGVMRSHHTVHASRVLPCYCSHLCESSASSGFLTLLSVTGVFPRGNFLSVLVALNTLCALSTENICAIWELNFAYH